MCIRDSHNVISCFDVVIFSYLCPFIFVPLMLQFFLSSNSVLKKSKIYDFLDDWLGSGLITADGKETNDYNMYVN